MGREELDCVLIGQRHVLQHPSTHEDIYRGGVEDVCRRNGVGDDG